MLTFTGTYVTKDNHFAPTPTDIAIHLGKIVRFGGACNGFWTVLHHLFVCHDLGLVFARDNDFNTRRTLYLLIDLLLHDAHESITSDIPKTWKHEAMNVLQDDLDQRIYSSLGLTLSNIDAHVIKDIDHDALISEAQVVCPKHLGDFFEEASEVSKEIVKNVREQYPDYTDTIGSYSLGVRKYINILNYYMNCVCDPQLLIDNQDISFVGSGLPMTTSLR